MENMIAVIVDDKENGNWVIHGTPVQLEALGHALLLKSKLQENFYCLMKGYVEEKSIELLTSEEYYQDHLSASDSK